MVAKRGRPFAQASDDAAKNRRRQEARERMSRLRIQRKTKVASHQRTPGDRLQQGEFIIRLASVGSNFSPPARCTTSIRAPETANDTFAHQEHHKFLQAIDETSSQPRSNGSGDTVVPGDGPQILEKIEAASKICSTKDLQPHTTPEAIRDGVGDLNDNHRSNSQRSPRRDSVASPHRAMSRSPSDYMRSNSETRVLTSAHGQRSPCPAFYSPSLEESNEGEPRFVEYSQFRGVDIHEGEANRRIAHASVDGASRSGVTRSIDPRLMHRRKLGAIRSKRYYHRKLALLGQSKADRKAQLHHAERMIELDQDEDDGQPGQTLVREKGPHSEAQIINERHTYDNNATFSRAAAISKSCQFSEPFGESSRKTLAVRLCDQLLHGFHGCSQEQHEAQFEKHQSLVGDNHNDLSEMFSSKDFPSVLGLSGILEHCHTDEAEMPEAAQWDEMFCGALSESTDGRGPVKNVCLHKERTQVTAPNISFDIDSFLGFATSLGVALKGLLHQPSPQARQNLENDVHFGLNTPDSNSNGGRFAGPSFSMLRDVPHLFLGRLVGAENVIVHVFLPHLEVQPGTSILNASQLCRWNDEILEPAIYEHFPSHYTQHLSAGYQHALANSRARQVEGRKIETRSYESQQAITYFLPPEHLDKIWTTAQRNITRSPGLRDFRDAQLYISAKGTKLQFKTDLPLPSLNHAISNFQSYLDGILNLEYLSLDRFFVDIGKEICPPTNPVLMSDETVLVEPQVYSWRRCCLQEYIRQLYDGQPPAAGGPGQRYYAQNMLYEACSLTSETPKRSKLREAVLMYSQFYASVKELFDASKCKPFDNDGLEELALDPQIRLGIHAAVRGHLPDYKIIERAYIASEGRVNNAILSSRQKSFGVREEHRISSGCPITNLSCQGLVG